MKNKNQGGESMLVRMFLFPVISFILISLWPFSIGIFPFLNQELLIILFIIIQIFFLVRLFQTYQKWEIYSEFPSYNDAKAYFKEENRVKRAEAIAKSKKMKKELDKKRLEAYSKKLILLEERKKELEIRAKKVL